MKSDEKQLYVALAHKFLKEYGLMSYYTEFVLARGGFKKLNNRITCVKDIFDGFSFCLIRHLNCVLHYYIHEYFKAYCYMYFATKYNGDVYNTTLYALPFSDKFKHIKTYDYLVAGDHPLNGLITAIKKFDL